MRIASIVGPFLFVALALCQDSAHPAPNDSHSLITAISVAEAGDGVDVEVTFTQPVQPEVQKLEHPDRLVLDFPGCQLAHPAQHLAVNRGDVRAVRADNFNVTPPIARVVIDLKSPQRDEENFVGNKLVIKVTPVRSAATAANNPPANTQPIAHPPAQAPPRVSEVAPRKTTVQPMSQPSRAAPVQPQAYALLAKAQALTISDLEPLEAKAQSGDPEAETTLGLAYHAGLLLKVNDAEALRLVKDAANRGFPAAAQAMGIFCQLGVGMAPDKTQAISWYTKAAQHGSTEAATSLALMYSTGDGIQRDPDKAVTWFRSAAELGDATAQLNLAALYHRGAGGPQDDAQAVLWLTKAADQGLLPAMLELGAWDLHHGANVDGAIGWFKKAADHGDASAQAALGDIFVDAKFGRLNYGEAVDWYRKAADQGNRVGQLGLGMRYLMGQGVPRDPEEARRWLTPAADQGQPEAQLVLAKLLQAGDGGPVDLESAAKYLELAANIGVTEAQYRLGLLLKARGNASDRIAAYKWLVLAEPSVRESAAAAKELRKSLNPSEVAQAERDIDNWRSAHKAPH